MPARGVAGLLCAVVCAAVWAGLPPERARADPPPEAERAFDRGRKAYERADYREAARHWERALARTPERGFARARARLALDISTAYERHFDASGDRESLRAARDHLMRYRAQLEAAYPDPRVRAREQGRARDRLARVERKLAAQRSTSRLQPGSGSAGERTRDELQRERKRKIAGGVVLTVVGVAGLAVLGYGVWIENTPIGVAGLVAALGGGVAGPVMIIFNRRRQDVALAANPEAPRLRVALGPAGAGLTLTGRF